MDLDDAIDKAMTLEIVEPSRCMATAKASGKRCTKRPEPGVKHCRFHGGKNEGKPNPRAQTHGLATSYVHKDRLPALIRRIEELRSREGKEEALLIGAADTEARLANVPESHEFLDTYTRARKSIREDLSTADELTRDQAPSQAPIIVVGNYQEAQSFTARTLEGVCLIRLIDGNPYMLVGDDYLRAVKLSDAETGAEYYSRLAT